MKDSHELELTKSVLKDAKNQSVTEKTNTVKRIVTGSNVTVDGVDTSFTNRS